LEVLGSERVNRASGGQRCTLSDGAHERLRGRMLSRTGGSDEAVQHTAVQSSRKAAEGGVSFVRGRFYRALKSCDSALMRISTASPPRREKVEARRTGGQHTFLFQRRISSSQRKQGCEQMHLLAAPDSHLPPTAYTLPALTLPPYSSIGPHNDTLESALYARSAA
jgi:hypothetical protein